MLGDTDERNPKFKRTAFHKMFPIAGMYPPSILPDEILRASDERVPQAYEEAFGSLELLVVVDVAITETARMAHYVLPAASQFEKWEFTGFNLEFPENAFHLRHPLFPKLEETLPEPEIYTRLLEKMGVLPLRFPWLSLIAKIEPKATSYVPFIAALTTALWLRPRLVPYAGIDPVPDPGTGAIEGCRCRCFSFASLHQVRQGKPRSRASCWTCR